MTRQWKFIFSNNIVDILSLITHIESYAYHVSLIQFIFELIRINLFQLVTTFIINEICMTKFVNHGNYLPLAHFKFYVQ